MRSAIRHIPMPMVAGTVLLVMMFCTLAATVGCMAVGYGINAVVFPVAVVLSLASAILFYGRDRTVLLTAVTTVAAVAVLAWLCALMTDHSYDGNAYHGEVIGRLLDGWNPLQSDADTPVTWVNGYAKALEMVSASVASFTGNVESGKVVNFMLAGAAVLLVAGGLQSVFPSLSAKRSWIVALLFGANPVVITQMFTFYNDYALYCVLVIVAVMMLLLYRDGWSWQWAVLALLATMIGMVTKFTHGFYLGVEWGAFLILLWVSRRRGARMLWRCAVLAVVGAVLGLGVLGYHPYLTNVERHGHPLYPLMGDYVEDIMSENTPSVFRDSGRVVNFVKSMAMVKHVTYDQRYGGFGPFMIPLLLLSAALLALAWRRWQFIYIAITILVAAFCFEQTWWVRYIPFVWALIPLGVLASMLSADNMMRGMRLIRGAIYLCVLLTLPVCAADALWLKIEASMYRRTLYERARQAGVVRVAIEPNDVHVRRRLDEAGINYRIVPRDEIDTTRALFLTNDGFRGDVIEFPIAIYDSLVAPGIRYKLLRMDERKLDFFDDMRPSD